MKKSMVIDKKYIRFFILGVSSYFLTFIQTKIYIELLLLTKQMAYGITQIVIFILNLILARYWVYESINTNIYKQGVRFFFCSNVFSVY